MCGVIDAERPHVTLHELSERRSRARLRLTASGPVETGWRPYERRFITGLCSGLA